MGLFGICHVVQIVCLYAYIYMYVLYMCVVENYATSKFCTNFGNFRRIFEIRNISCDSKI